ncbi:MAG TPA: GNVR domain-containing protein [Longimicrobiales bacterium]
MVEGTTVREHSVLELWAGVLRRRGRMGVAIFLAIVGLAAALVFLTRPVYRAEARLRLGEPPPMGGVSPGGGLLALMRLGGDPFANDLELLGSRSLAESVVEKLALHVELRARRGWHRDSMLVRLEAGRVTQKAAYEAEWTDDGLIRVRRTAPGDSLVGTVRPGETFAFDSVRVAFRPWREGMPRTAVLRVQPFGEAVRRFRGRLTLERARREANVLDIAYDHVDPGVAQRVVAAAVEEFVELRAAVQRRESGETVDSLARVVEATLRELSDAESELAALQRRARLVAPDAQSEVLVEQYAELGAELERARLGRAAAEELMRRVARADTPGVGWSGLAAIPDLAGSTAISQLLERLEQLQAQRAELASRFAPEGRAITVLDRQIRELDASLRTTAAAYLDQAAERERALATRVAELDAELAELPDHVMTMARLQRRVRILSEMLVLTEQRLRQEELRQALTFSNIQVIDPPALRYKPVWPRKKLGLAAGLLLASVFSMLGMAAAERADGTVRGAAAVRGLAGAPVLAAVPADDGRIMLTAAEARAILRAACTPDGDVARLTFAPVDGEAPARALARALAERVEAEGAERAGAATSAPLVFVAPPVDGYPAAVEAAAHGAPVVLVAEHGRTRRRALRTAVALLTEAGAAPAGVVLACPHQRDATNVWA